MSTLADLATTVPAAKPDREVDTVWALVQRVQAGDTAAFAGIYERYHPMMAGWIYKRVGHRQLAEDLTGDVFVRALRNINTVSWRGKDFGAWLTTIARNLVMDYFKSAHHRFEVTIADLLDIDRADDDRYCSPEWATITSLTNADLLEAIGKLTPKQSQVVSLRYLDQMSTAETARAMGGAEGSVKALLHWALAALRAIVASDDIEPMVADGQTDLFGGAA